MVITLQKGFIFYRCYQVHWSKRNVQFGHVGQCIHLIIVIVYVEVEFDWFNNPFKHKEILLHYTQIVLGVTYNQKLTAVFVSNDVTYTPLEVGIRVGLDKGIYWTNTSLFVWFWGFVWDWWAVWVTLFISNWSWNKYRTITPLGSLWRTFYSDMLCKIWNRYEIISWNIIELLFNIQ